MDQDKIKHSYLSLSNEIRMLDEEAFNVTKAIKIKRNEKSKLLEDLRAKCQHPSAYKIQRFYYDGFFCPDCCVEWEDKNSEFYRR